MEILNKDQIVSGTSRKQQSWKIVVLLLVVLGLSAAFSGCAKKSETTAATSKTVSCQVTTLRSEMVPQLVVATGSLQADISINVSTRMMGWVKKVHVVEGQTVAKGDPLISIDDSDLVARKAQATAGIAEAEAVLANAQRMSERFQKLYDEKSVSRQQLDDVLTGRDRAAAGVKMARAGLTEVNVHLGYLQITATTDGVVARKMIEEGNMANPGMPLLVIEQTDRIKVVAHLAEKDISNVKTGDLVTVDVTSIPGAVHSVELSRVTPTANPGSRTYDIEAFIDNAAQKLRSGMFARVSVPVGHRQATLVTAEAIIRRGQLTGVWIVDDQDTARLRWIRLGRAVGNSFEALSGLSGTEKLVVSSAEPLAEGDKVVN